MLTDDDPLLYVISANLQRRHLDESQRALVAARIANMPQGARTDLAAIEARSQPEAAAKLNVSRASVQRAAVVLKSEDNALIARVEAGTIAVDLAEKIARLTLLARLAMSPKRDSPRPLPPSRKSCPVR